MGVEATCLSLVGDAEIDCLALVMIGQHGEAAARAAVERLNESIDDGDLHGRDVWARVVQVIHERQRGSGAPLAALLRLR